MTQLQDPDAVRTGGRSEPASPAPKIRLGEELPVFCERCGYSLHGLPQNRCDRCAILHFHCPECGHHQPINTLRPAAQRILGRLRAMGLVLVVLVKLNLLGWPLFAWFIMGAEWSAHWDWTKQRTVYVWPALSWDLVLSFALFAIPFGMVGRMLLLRWRSGMVVALALATLVCGAVNCGAFFAREMAPSYRNNGLYEIGPLLTADYALTLGLTFACVMLAALLAWPAWVALTHLLLPSRTARALLDWQSSLSDPTSLART